MSTTIDTRGLSCPPPVINGGIFTPFFLMFLTAVKGDDQGPFCVLVDNDASLENVSRAARNRGFDVAATAENEGVTRLDITRA